MFKRKYRLRTLMLALSVGGILLTSILLLTALTILQKGNIEDRLLESNIAYARKLADTTDRYLVIAQRELSYSASLITALNNQDQLEKEADRLRLQSGFFNSVVIVTSDAVIAATSPESLGLIGVKLNSDASRYAIKYKEPFVSSPFTSAAGNYVVFLSQPLFSPDRRYLGFIGGTIYLKKKSMLSDILSQHFYVTQTSVSVVAGNGDIIFNKHPELIGEKLPPDSPLQKRLELAHSGHFVENEEHSSNIIGYATLKQADWSIFISGTTENVNGILTRTVINAFWFTLAIIALTVAIVIFFAARISLPLEKLAELTRSEKSEHALKRLKKLNAWYMEADRLREAVSHHLQIVAQRVNTLNDETMTDILTGLYNRKGFSTLVDNYLSDDEHCIVAIDIDHFKAINDKYGHDVGDSVLRELSEKLRKICREQDIICRFGGEEFIIFLPHTTLDESAGIAERIRYSIACADFACEEGITISLGVTDLFHSGGEINIALRQADQALYEAKRVGRNVVIISGLHGYFCYSAESF